MLLSTLTFLTFLLLGYFLVPPSIYFPNEQFKKKRIVIIFNWLTYVLEMECCRPHKWMVLPIKFLNQSTIGTPLNWFCCHHLHLCTLCYFEDNVYSVTDRHIRQSNLQAASDGTFQLASNSLKEEIFFIEFGFRKNSNSISLLKIRAILNSLEVLM